MKANKQQWSRRRFVLATIVALLALVAVAPAGAAVTRGGDNVVIGPAEVIEGDLYVAGNTVTVDGTIKGDLVAVASQVTINGTIEGDVLAGGQGVVVNGTVADDVRAVAQAVLLGSNARLAGDLAVGALSVESRPGSLVGGDLLAGAYQALLAGDISRNIVGGLDRLELRGAVGGSVDLDIGADADTSAAQFSPVGQLAIPSVPAGLTIADSARIDGNLVYRSSARASIPPATRIGGNTSFVPVARAEADTAPVIPGLGYLQQLAGLLIAGLLLVWLAPGWTRSMADTIETKPLPSLGWGLVGFFVFVAAVVGTLVLTIALAMFAGLLTLGGLAAMVASVGVLIGASLVLAYITFAAYIAAGVVGYMAGRWIVRRFQPAWTERQLVPLAIGLVVFVVLTSIPWIGPLLGLAVVLLALGALWQWGRGALRREPAPAASRLQPA